MIHCFILERLFDKFYLVANRAACSGEKENMGRFKKVESCAKACKSYEMFVFGTGTKCTKDDETCNCFCQIDTTNYECNTQIDDTGYNLYALRGKG